jgi:signal transduction histidine kinase
LINDVSGKVILGFVSAFIHLNVLAVYWLGGKSANFPLTWSYPYTIIILLMMLVSMFMLSVSDLRICRRLFFLRFVFTAILSVPFANDMLSYGFIFALLIFEGFLYLSFTLGSVLTLICIAYNVYLINLPLYLWYVPPQPRDMESLMLTFTLYATCGLAGFYLGIQNRMRKKDLKIIQELQFSNKKLAEINIELQDLAIEERNNTLNKERNRIAREIHDTVAYTLTNLLSLLDAFREKLLAEAQEVPENIIQARALVREGLVDIRKVLRGLRPGENEGYQGLWSIMHLVNIFSKATGIKVLLNFGQVPQFPGNDIEDVLYRIVQEGLTNSFRHGHATEVIVNFYYDNRAIELVISDNGRGSETVTGGFGLIGISERVKSFEGIAAFSSKLEFGFTLRVWLPLKKEDLVHGVSTNRNS